MRRRALLCTPLALAACHNRLAAQDVDVRGLVPNLDFAMTDAATGRTVTQADVRGDIALLYFGYTNCPDVCPATLYNIQRVQARMGAAGARLRTLFVTVDPDRDTPHALAQYAALFGPDVIGLRGSADQLYALARRYRVVFSVTKTPDYSVTHSAAVYVFDGSGAAQFIIAGLENPKPDLDGIARDLRAVT